MDLHVYIMYPQYFFRLTRGPPFKDGVDPWGVDKNTVGFIIQEYPVASTMDLGHRILSDYVSILSIQAWYCQ